MKRLGRMLRTTILALVACVLVVLGWLTATKVTAADLPPLRDGDIVFQTSGSGQNLAIAAASHSAYTHTGLVQLDANGQAFVLEAIGPVTVTPLSAWIKEGIGGRITVKRVKSLTPDMAKQAIAAGHVYDGAPYDFFFLPGKEEIYCSELVHLAFEEGPHISVGKVQKVRELSLNNTFTRQLINERWQNYPLCTGGKATSLDQCMTIMEQQDIVTPASIARDPQLQTIYSNYGPLTE